ncbi:hypothetical protein [uncultured Winogradskyella sp.]|uniref:hypothetical protein n=1 Tax=uncultured Winogradskyella sp. TaxID=395353 RepID=UPI00262C31AD|nr:hypothetical protein [uncultured Winogradskyella sp.]
MSSSNGLHVIILMTLFFNIAYSQDSIEYYEPLAKDSLRVGLGDDDFMPFIRSGYTLMLPENRNINGVLIFLEDSGYDDKNKSAKQLYKLASKSKFAVLSVSTEIPFDFYFLETSFFTVNRHIKHAFKNYKLPNKNIFFLGASLTGHRALRYIKLMSENRSSFQLKIQGIVICNFALDWVRKWNQYQREIKIDRNNLWEAKFISYTLETYLGGSPLKASEGYYNFSAYSYFDKKYRNIKFYKNYAIKAYIEPAIKYRLMTYAQTMYENSATDIVSFLAELMLAGNKNTELEVLQPHDNLAKNINADATWKRVDKIELMRWIELHSLN